ncbi:MAG: energy transducer TonB [Chitinophagales bacterium]
MASIRHAAALLCLFLSSCKSNNDDKGEIKPLPSERFTAQSTLPSHFNARDVSNKPTIVLSKILKVNGATPVADQSQDCAASLQQNYPPSVFCIYSNRDTVIAAAQGTRLHFKANSFVSEKSGAAIDGPVTIEVKEYYRMPDILLAGLATQSGDALLESGGMLHITASSKGETCNLKTGADYAIIMPAKDKKNDMKMFYGVPVNAEQLDWQLPEERIIYKTRTYEGVYATYFDIIRKRLIYPDSAKQQNIQGTTEIGFHVCPDGIFENPVVVASSGNRLLDEAAMTAVSASRISRRSKGINKPVNFVMPIDFGGKMSVFTKGKRTEIYYAVSKETIYHSGTADEVTRYLFSASKLGWINCDRFYESKEPKVVCMIKEQEADLPFTEVKLVFKNMKSVLNGTRTSKGFHFTNVPQKEPVTIVGIRYDHKKLFLAMKDTVTSSVPITALSYQPVTTEELKERLEKL